MSEKQFFIKKPIPIEAYKFDPARKADYIVNLEYADGGKGVDCKWGIQTLEGMHEVKIGDWIITGVRGERYPIKGDIFEETYAPTLEAAATLQPGEGWKMVPVEPTNDMCIAAIEKWKNGVYSTFEGPGPMLYAAMLSASPSPVIPSAGGEDDDEGLGLEAKRPVNLSPAPAPQGMEVLERVARAIYGAKWDHWRPGWKEHFDDPEWDKQDRDMAFLQARAAIAALQEQKP